MPARRTVHRTRYYSFECTGAAATAALLEWCAATFETACMLTEHRASPLMPVIAPPVFNYVVYAYAPTMMHATRVCGYLSLATASPRTASYVYKCLQGAVQLNVCTHLTVAAIGAHCSATHFAQLVASFRRQYEDAGPRQYGAITFTGHRADAVWPVGEPSATIIRTSENNAQHTDNTESYQELQRQLDAHKTQLALLTQRFDVLAHKLAHTLDRVETVDDRVHDVKTLVPRLTRAERTAHRASVRTAHLWRHLKMRRDLAELAAVDADAELAWHAGHRDLC